MILDKRISQNINYHKILIIIIYFGKWPWYFAYFINSCKFNCSVDFVIFSDNVSHTFRIPENVKFINYSIQMFKKDTSLKLGFEVEINHGYKICDFKPAFGLIFEDWISGYDFWGYCDIDLIFGNIRNFITEKLLNEFDVISARHDYLTGSFALYRNNQFMIKLFTQSKDHKKVLTDPRNFCFDETNYAFEPFLNRVPYKEIQTEIESMTHVIRRLEEVKKIKPYFEFQIIEGFAGNMLWENGVLIYRKKFEALYYHLVRMKRIYSEENANATIMPYRFRIGKTNFYGKKYDHSLQ
jgi:hypothetical protein